MKRLLLPVLTAVAVMVFGGRAMCQENATVENGPALSWISGTVSQVSFVKSFLYVITEKGYLTFTVDEKTTINIGPEKADLSEIKPEDSVRIQYYCPEPGKYVAVAVSESKRPDYWAGGR